MKSKLPEGPRGRINHWVRQETYKNVLVFAAETGRTVSSAVDYLLRRGLIEYTKLHQDGQADGPR